jgi:hypothetical protein
LNAFIAVSNFCFMAGFSLHGIANNVNSHGHSGILKS